MKKIIPGLLDANFEFFNASDDVMFVQNGNVQSFSNLPAPIHSLLKETIEKDSEVKKILNDWHPDSEFHQIKQLVSCRFGGMDFKADIENGVLQEGEYWSCPKSGNCKAEGILCKSPEVNGNALSKMEIELIKLSTTDKTNEVIAEILEIPLGTYHKMKKILHQKLGNIQTKQCLTRIAYELNII